MIRETYIGLQIATSPVTRKAPRRYKRNAEIRARYQNGELLCKLAEVFGISEQRMYQIIQGRRN